MQKPDRLYTTVRDYEQRVVEPALGQCLLDHNARAIAFDCLTWNVQAQEYEDLTAEEEFWSIVEKHRYPDVYTECSIELHDKRGKGAEFTMIASVSKGADTVDRYRIIHRSDSGLQKIIVKNIQRRQGLKVVFTSEKGKWMSTNDVIDLVRKTIRERRV